MAVGAGVGVAGGTGVRVLTAGHMVSAGTGGALLEGATAASEACTSLGEACGGARVPIRLPECSDSVSEACAPSAIWATSAPPSAAEDGFAVLPLLANALMPGVSIDWRSRSAFSPLPALAAAGVSITLLPPLPPEVDAAAVGEPCAPSAI